MTRSLQVLVLFVLLGLFGCSQEKKEVQESAERPQTLKTIVAMGDSLTAGYGLEEQDGYPVQLEKKLRADGHPYRVINAGVSAETSSGALSRLAWVLNLQPDIVILETGANDGLRGIDAQVVESNIREMLRILKEKKVVVVLAGMQMVRNLGPIYVGQFNSVYPRLAEEFSVVFIPFFLEGVAMKRELNQEDGIHPNKAGYQKITDTIYPYVVKAIKQRDGR